MGHRGIYKVVENGQRAAYYTHWGVASPFSIFRRLLCAVELKEGDHADKSMIDILAHLSEDGEYHLHSEGMFELLSRRAGRYYDTDFNTTGYMEMRVTLNFDTNTAFLEHNPHYRVYKYVGNYYIPIDQGIHNIRAVLAYAQRTGMDNVVEIAAAFHRHTGMEAVYDRAIRRYNAEADAAEQAANPHGIREHDTFDSIDQKFEEGLNTER